MKGFSRRLVLKLRHQITRKWPISVRVIRSDKYVTLSHMQLLLESSRNAPPIALVEEHS